MLRRILSTVNIIRIETPWRGRRWLLQLMGEVLAAEDPSLPTFVADGVCNVRTDDLDAT
jgi:hypothetical protein